MEFQAYVVCEAVDYIHEYQVFPTDGTSSEYSCTTYAKLESRKDAI